MSSDHSSQRILQGLKMHGPQTAAQIGEQLGMSAMGARQHLLNLEQEALVTSFEEASGRGRPARFWQLSGAGHRQFPDGHGDLTHNLIENVRELFGESGLEQLILQREQQLLTQYQSAMEPLKTLAARVKKLAALRAAEGYMATAVSEGQGRWLLLENHCPICSAARQCQQFCRSELALFRQTLNAEVERCEYLFDGARRCAYRISPHQGK